MTDVAHEDAPPGAPENAPENWVPVERRFLGFDKATIVPTVVILIFVLALGTWLPNINKLISYDNEAKAGDVLDLGEGITITPVPGWNIVKGLRVTDEPVTGTGRGRDHGDPGERGGHLPGGAGAVRGHHVGPARPGQPATTSC